MDALSNEYIDTEGEITERKGKRKRKPSSIMTIQETQPYVISQG